MNIKQNSSLKMVPAGVLHFFAAVLVSLVLTPSRAGAQVLIPVKELMDHTISGLLEVDGTDWITVESAGFETSYTSFFKLVDGIAYPIQDLSGIEYPRVIQFKGATFINSDYTDLSLVTNEGSKPIEGIDDSGVAEVFNTEDRLWFVSYSENLYEWDGQRAIQIMVPPNNGPAEDGNYSSSPVVQTASGETWLITRNLLYRLDGASFSLVQTPQVADSDDFEEVGGVAWLSSDLELFVWRSGTFAEVRTVDARPLLNAEVYADGAESWALSNDLLYKLSGATATLQVELQVEEIPNYWSESTVVHAAGNTFLKGSTKCFKLSNGQLEELPGLEGKEVRELFGFDSELFIETTAGLYHWDTSGAKPIEGVNGAPLLLREEDDHHYGGRIEPGVYQIANTIWIYAVTGLYQWEDDQPAKLLFEATDRTVNGLFEHHATTFILTSGGLYKCEEGIPSLVRNTEHLNFMNSHKSPRGWYLTCSNTRTGTFEFVRGIDYSIDVGLSAVVLRKLDSKSAGARHFIPSGDWQLTARYVDAQGQTVDVVGGMRISETPNHFQWYAMKSEADLPESTDFFPMISPYRAVPGNHQAAFLVRDKWGNEVLATANLVVLPAWSLLARLAPALWLAFLLLCFGLAPHYTWCHRSMMSPAIRDWGSAKLIPGLLSLVPPLRRHLCRRFMGGLRKDRNIMQWKERYIVPSDDFYAKDMLQLLMASQKTLITGESGLGKTCLMRYLVANCATEGRLCNGRIPIYIPFSLFTSGTIIEMIHAQLEKYGELTDSKLNEDLLRQSEFIIFFDGLNELDEDMRSQVGYFVNRTSNVVVVSSQPMDKMVPVNRTIELKGFDRKEIEIFVTKRLGEAKASNALDSFTEDTYAICHNPQDLELTLEVLESGGRLPTSRSELYQDVLQPILDSWRSGVGVQSYTSALSEAAFKLVASGKRFFSASEVDIPTKALGDLVKPKLVIQQGDEYHFRHDLVRAYLASRYLLARWKETLEDEKLKIDIDWRSMLEFVILDLKDEKGRPDKDAVNELWLLLADQHGNLAMAIKKWLAESHPELAITKANLKNA